MKPLLLISFILLAACATKSPEPRFGKMTYSYTDVTGTYRLNKETKLKGQQLISRYHLLGLTSDKVLEKSIAVSRLGTIKGKKGRILVLRPEAAEFTVWLEGKKYSTLMRINPAGKSMKLVTERPESASPTVTQVPFPQGKNFCFYSQLSDCLHQSKLLEQAEKRPHESFNFFVIWDSYPFVQEQFTNVGKNLFAAASLKFDGKVKKGLRYLIELEGQIVLYHFSKAHDLIKMAWIAQGVTIVPPGEEIADED